MSGEAERAQRLEEALARVAALAAEWEHDKLHGLRYAARVINQVLSDAARENR